MEDRLTMKRLRLIFLGFVLLAVTAIWFAGRYDTDNPQTINLIKAIDIGDMSAVQALIEHGARVSGLVNNPYSGIEGAAQVSPLEWAYHKKRKEIVGLLKKHDAHFRSWPYTEAVFLAVDYGDVDELRYLIGKGASLKWKDKVGQTLLHYAAWKGDYEITALLVEHGCDVNARSENGGTTPLHHATEFFPGKDVPGAGRIVELLISKGANPELKGFEGKTPRDYAIQNKFTGIVSVLDQNKTMEATKKSTHP